MGSGRSGVSLGCTLRVPRGGWGTWRQGPPSAPGAPEHASQICTSLRAQALTPEKQKLVKSNFQKQVSNMLAFEVPTDTADDLGF